MNTKRYFTTSQVDGRRLAKVLMAKHDNGYVTFSRETNKERTRWENSGALAGKRYWVTLNSTVMCYTEAIDAINKKEKKNG